LSDVAIYVHADEYWPYYDFDEPKDGKYNYGKLYHLPEELVTELAALRKREDEILDALHAYAEETGQKAKDAMFD
jgi:hypothetical protein